MYLLKNKITKDLVMRSAVFFSVLNSLLPLISLYIYARLLSPEAYGNFTATIVVVSVLSSLIGFSLGPAIVKESDDGNKSLYLLLIVFLSIISSIILLVFSVQIGALLKNSMAGELLGRFFWLPSLIAISGYFQFLQIRDLKTLRVLVSTFISYCLSYFLFGFFILEEFGDEYVLLSCLAFFEALRLLLNFKRVPFSRGEMNLGFSIFNTSALTFNSFALQIDNIFISRSNDSYLLGIYGRAYSLFTLPAIIIGDFSEKYIYPRVKDKKSAAIKGLYYMYPYGLTLALFTFFFSEYLIVKFLGPGWDGVASVIAIMCVAIPNRALQKYNDMLLRKEDRAATLFLLQLFYASLLFILIISLSLLGMELSVYNIALCVVIAIIAHSLLQSIAIIGISNLSNKIFLRVLPLLLLQIFYIGLVIEN